MVDLTTTYLGLPLKNPLVVSASPLSKKVSNVKKMEAAGAAAVVMYSLFEEQIDNDGLDLEHRLHKHLQNNAGVLSHLPDMDYYNRAPAAYLEHLRQVKQAVSIPIIGSLNGVATGDWITYAQAIEQAGADGLELNLYYLPVDPRISSTEIEGRYIKLVRDVRCMVKIPIAVKLNPYFASLPYMARRLVRAGADGLVLFNRFYQPDFDIETMDVVPGVSLSTSADLRLPLRWIAILYGQIPTDFALTSGVHCAPDVLKAVMAGANVTMLASELIANGIGRLGEILTELRTWMNANGYQTIRQIRGSLSQEFVAEPAAFERAYYLKALNTYDLRVL